ncbi:MULTISPECIES: type III secretion protein hrcQa [Pseudomonas syringae group]|uniref:Type III secretion protein hrcQa n=3 Tax=Pseudomonas syringae group TaxID=136849 RepID=A0ABY1U359_PSESX|nr:MULTISPECIES: type III secretion protein hrcQa [Pseudomonas syringae group]KPC05755.1 Type III secretion protein HrcQa [Pseudomonas amygdali pv. lachrymans]EGH95157.1 type III secretion protein HrcQa [Pseudomonas amygdali pv. lachrymans str. M302278]KPC14173.1 Type III secretion protein HrcQa [Pseudomonas syringae pv. maculicola str. M6]KPX74853.1 Type III secretion protein HrcQa [Pseudomonas syringae pv. maculicola]KWT13593.1 type III secretion system protein [Pseudomonas syringae pv. avii
MSALCLRKVDPLLAQVSRELGAGQCLSFSAKGQQAELTLLPLIASDETPAKGVWLNTAVGALCLSDAEALLSLLGDIPLTLGGEQQAWYWQFFNQRLSPTIADLLAPVEPLPQACAELTVGCRIQVRLADQQVHAHLHATPETLLTLLRSAAWQARLKPLDERWSISTPLILGELSLTLEQLASLRPGDVLLPANCKFDSAGQGFLTLAGRQWAAQTDSQDQHLLLRLSHEEHSHHEY